jgi:hypothetical protein
MYPCLCSVGCEIHTSTTPYDVCKYANKQHRNQGLGREGVLRDRVNRGDPPSLQVWKRKLEFRKWIGDYSNAMATYLISSSYPYPYVPYLPAKVLLLLLLVALSFVPWPINNSFVRNPPVRNARACQPDGSNHQTRQHQKGTGRKARY